MSRKLLHFEVQRHLTEKSVGGCDNFVFLSVHAFQTTSDSDDSDGEVNHADKAYRLRLTKALACLGVKPSSFNALVVDDKYDDVEELLKEHLINTTHEFQHRQLKILNSYAKIQTFLYFRNALGNHLDLPEKHGLRKEKKKISMKEYAPYIDLQADLPTILEAYHFLIKKFVLNPRERKRRIDKAKAVLASIAGFYEAQEAAELEELVKKEREEMLKKEKELQRRQSSKNYFTPPDYSMINEEINSRNLLQEFDDLQLEDPLIASSKNRLNIRRKTLAEPMSMEEMLKIRLEEHEKRLFKGTRRKSEVHFYHPRSRKSSNVSDGYSSSNNLSRKSSIRSSRKNSTKTPTRSRSKSPFKREEQELIEKPKNIRKLSVDLTVTTKLK